MVAVRFGSYNMIMLLFMIKKSFFDVWDNLLAVALLNLGLLVALAPPFILARTEVIPILPAIGIGLVVLVGFQYLGMAGRFARDMTDYRRAAWGNLWSYFKQSAVAGLVLGLIELAHLLLLLVALPFYNALNNLLGFSALTLLFWISLAWILAAQYYVPLQTRFDNRPLKLIRKGFLLLLDNIGFTIMLAIGGAVHSADFAIDRVSGARADRGAHLAADWTEVASAEI